MGKLNTRHREQDTYRQTFNFADPPLYPFQDPKQNKQKFINCQEQNFITHKVIRSQTQQQKMHKVSLQRTVTKHQVSPQQFSFKPTKHLQSRIRKQNDLKGQLQVGGTGQFLKPQYDYQNNLYKPLLLGYDRNFLQCGYEAPSRQNQLAVYDKGKISEQLKQSYDFGYCSRQKQGYCDTGHREGRTFVFIEKKK